MPTVVKDKALCEEAARVYREHGYNMTVAARAIGVPRKTLASRVRGAHEHGILEDEEVKEPNRPQVEDYISAKARKARAFAEKKRKGDWRKPTLIPLPPVPFRLNLYGDPHLDADGCDPEAFERAWLDMGVGTYGVCVGDWFNNWRKSLAHLWREESTHPSDAWTIFDHLMHERGEYLLAACSGNHDDWSHAPSDPIDMVMKRHGVRYRIGAIRLQLDFEGCEPLHVSIRHKWRGKSMYSAAHWGAAHANTAWRDPIMVGGHIHQDDQRLIRRDDGVWCHVCQLSSFKEFDTYVDVEGFTGTRISPVWHLVIDPRESSTNVDRIKTFWCAEKAERYREAIT